MSDYAIEEKKGASSDCNGISCEKLSDLPQVKLFRTYSHMQNHHLYLLTTLDHLRLFLPTPIV